MRVAQTADRIYRHLEEAWSQMSLSDQVSFTGFDDSVEYSILHDDKLVRSQREWDEAITVLVKERERIERLAQEGRLVFSDHKKRIANAKAEYAKQIVESTPLKISVMKCDKTPTMRNMPPNILCRNSFLYITCVNNESVPAVIKVMRAEPSEWFNISLRDMYGEEVTIVVPSGDTQNIALYVTDNSPTHGKRFDPRHGLNITFGIIPTVGNIPEGAIWERPLYLSPNDLLRGVKCDD